MIDFGICRSDSNIINPPPDACVIVVDPTPVTAAPSAPASSEAPVFTVPGTTLFPGRPYLPDTRLADTTQNTPSAPVALLTLAGLGTLLGLSMTAARRRRSPSAVVVESLVR